MTLRFDNISWIRLDDETNRLVIDVRIFGMMQEVPRRSATRTRIDLLSERFKEFDSIQTTFLSWRRAISGQIKIKRRITRAYPTLSSPSCFYRLFAVIAASDDSSS